MPVFLAGSGFAQTMAAVLDVPFYRFSHQEGHIEAIKRYSKFNDQHRFLCYHLSGGTCELLAVDRQTAGTGSARDKKNRGTEIQIIGGTKDISFGQLLDRIGVAMGLSFPAGEEMDRLALCADKPSSRLKEIALDGLYMNLSGIETQCLRTTQALEPELIRELFDKIASVLTRLTMRAAKEYRLQHVLFTGGVSGSKYISSRIKDYFSDTNIHVDFGIQKLAQDNAVGIALLGGNTLWQ
jgi:N6-L-threonylcarbamoyladenine synthase